MARFILALSILVSNFAHAAVNHRDAEAEARVFGVADGAVDMSPKFDFDISWGWLFAAWFVAVVLVCLFFAGAKRLNKRYDGTEFQDSTNFSN